MTAQVVVAPDLPASISVEARCVGSRVMLTVEATNEHDERVTAVIRTPYGSRTYPVLQPGHSRQVTVPVRQQSVEAGTVSVTVTAGGAHGEATADYEAISCS